MLRIEFTSAQIKALHYERFHHPHPRVRLKMEVLWLKSQGLSHKEIVRLTCIGHTTLRCYLKEYMSGEIEKLKQLNFHRPQSELVIHQEKIKSYFKDFPPTTIKEAAAKIEEITGIKRGQTQTRKFLEAMGMRCLKVGVMPSKADPDMQEEFQKKKLLPRLEEAKAGKRAVFFVDAAHFVHGAFLGFVWCFVRPFIKSPSGRKRFNVLAALNAVTHELFMITNETYINAESVCELLRKLANLSLNIPITLVLDNAKYQKCKLVEDLAKSLKIELLYLPSYSPNLNLIERLWKFVKKKCLYSKYYSDFSEYKTAISDLLTQAHITHKQDLDSLLTLKFQTFKKNQLMTTDSHL